MSWGERSCIHMGRGTCPVEGGPTLDGCNVSCPKYVHDGQTPPDSKVRPGRAVELPRVYRHPFANKEPMPRGRNDPCPCGSKKKFKKCCMGKI